MKMNCLVTTMLAAVVLYGAVALAGEKEDSIAVAITDYLVAGRSVIAKNQPLINDPAKGDKGFTPAVYQAQVREAYMSLSNIDIKELAASEDPFNRAVLAVHASASEVIAEAQSQINEAGKGFKGFNPAVFGARVGDKLYKKSGIKLKQTSMKFRGDYNKPDEFEAGILGRFEKGEKGKPFFEQTASAVRYMVPLYIEKPCLTCHGDPAGEKDVSGRIKEGYKLGELRGAISVIVPLK